MAKPPFDAEAARQQRLAAALRANLAKRKARDRAMADGPETQNPPPDDPAGD